MHVHQLHRAVFDLLCRDCRWIDECSFLFDLGVADDNKGPSARKTLLATMQWIGREGDPREASTDIRDALNAVARARDWTD